jgi:hypothetical protein
MIVPNVTIVDAERTLWDKVVILHGLRRWSDTRGTLERGCLVVPVCCEPLSTGWLSGKI